jgi:putative transposase
MGEVEAKKDMVTRHDLRHDRHTDSLLTDHLVFSPKYRGKVLEGEIAEAAEELIRETCKELDIEVIDMAVGVDHVHLFIKYPPKYSVSWIAKRIKGRSSKLIRDQFTQLKVWCPGHLWAPSCYHGSVGHGWEVVERYISGQKGLEKTDVIRGERGEGSRERYSYEKADTVPVAVIDEEKEKAHKTWYITLYNKLFGREHQK